MRLHDFFHNRQAKPHAFGLCTFSTPKPIEYLLSIDSGNARSLIRYADASLGIGPDQYFAARGCVDDRVFNEVPDRICNGMSVSPDMHRTVRSPEGDDPFSRQRPR